MFILRHDANKLPKIMVFKNFSKQLLIILAHIELKTTKEQSWAWQGKTRQCWPYCCVFLNLWLCPLNLITSNTDQCYFGIRKMMKEGFDFHRADWHCRPFVWSALCLQFIYLFINDKISFSGVLDQVCAHLQL